MYQRCQAAYLFFVNLCFSELPHFFMHCPLIDINTDKKRIGQCWLYSHMNSSSSYNTRYSKGRVSVQAICNHSDCVYTVVTLLLVLRYSAASNSGVVAECLVSNLAIRVRVTGRTFFFKIICKSNTDTDPQFEQFFNSQIRRRAISRTTDKKYRGCPLKIHFSISWLFSTFSGSISGLYISKS